MHEVEIRLHDGKIAWAVGIAHHALDRAEVRRVGAVGVNQRAVRADGHGRVPADGRCAYGDDSGAACGAWDALDAARTLLCNLDDLGDLDRLLQHLYVFDDNNISHGSPPATR